MSRADLPSPLLPTPTQRRLTNVPRILEDSRTSSDPLLSPIDPSAPLILDHDADPLSEFDSDDSDEDHSPHFDVRRVSVPPLSPALVFLYLLAPYLKLGAIFIQRTELPLEHGLPALLIFAGLSVFSRQLWFMLSRYMRTLEFEVVILDTFARGRGRERRRAILRTLIRGATGALRILLATVYLRESRLVLLPLIPHSYQDTTIPIVLTIVISLALLPLSLAQSLASKSAIYSTGLSLVAYLVWLSCITHAHIYSIPLPTSGWLRMGAFWQGIATMAFAFTSSWTIPLYASLRGSAPPLTTAKPSRFRSFKLLSLLSVAVAVLLTLPPVFFAANPKSSFPPSASSPSLTAAIAIAKATTLLLGIPVLIITTPPLPIPGSIRYATRLPISRLIFSLLPAVLTLGPSRIVTVVLNDITLLASFLSTYFLPAFTHVTAHFFKRPLSIVMPPTGTSALAAELPHPDFGDGPSLGAGARSRMHTVDELLLRKERALQRTQWRRRIVWDLGVWALLLGGGAGFVWAMGRVGGWW